MTVSARISQLFVGARGTDVLFHHTMLHAAEKILTEKLFRLKTAQGSPAEKEFAAHSGMNYYLSTTRSKVGGYHVGQKTNTQVMFNLNGRALAARRDTRVRPLEYWNEPGKKQTWLVMREAGDAGATPEMEDRVFCRAPTLPADATTIDSVHVLIPELAKVYKPLFMRDGPDEFKVATDNVKWSRLAFHIISLAKKARIPAFFYTEHNAFLTQNRLKRVPVIKMRKYFEAVKRAEPAGEYERLVAREGKMGGRGRTMLALRELIHKKKVSELSPVARRQYDLLVRRWDVKDTARQLETDFHNDRGAAHAELSRVEDDMKRLGLKSVLELAHFLHEKWVPKSVQAAVLRVEARRAKKNGPKEFRLAHDDQDARRQDRDALGGGDWDAYKKWAPTIKRWPLSVSELRDVERQIFQHPDWLKYYARFDWTSWQRPMVQKNFDKREMVFRFYDVPRIGHDNRPENPDPNRTWPDRSSLTLDMNGKIVEKRSQYDHFYAYLPTAVEVCRDYVRDRAPFIRENMKYLDKPVYVRYGRWRDDERSKNFLASKQRGEDVWENSVSCYHVELDIDAGHWEIDLSINEDTINGTLESLFYGTKKIYLVTGTEIGEGSDGEPLLKNVKLLKELDRKEVKVSGVFDDD